MKQNWTESCNEIWSVYLWCDSSFASYFSWKWAYCRHVNDPGIGKLVNNWSGTKHKTWNITKIVLSYLLSVCFLGYFRELDNIKKSDISAVFRRIFVYHVGCIRRKSISQCIPHWVNVPPTYTHTRAHTTLTYLWFSHLFCRWNSSYFHMSSLRTRDSTLFAEWIAYNEQTDIYVNKSRKKNIYNILRNHWIWVSFWSFFGGGAQASANMHFYHRNISLLS